jgi:hypothetical protein
MDPMLAAERMNANARTGMCKILQSCGFEDTVVNHLILSKEIEAGKTNLERGLD